MEPETPQNENVGLVRELGLLDSTFLVIGITVGSGIFLTTGVMAESLPHVGWLLAAWAVGGLLAMAGALTYAELGAAMPEAGGQYVYLREAYGPLAAFLFGWIIFLVYLPGSIAAVAMGFAVYVGYFLPGLSVDNVLVSVELAGIELSISAGQLVAAGIMIFLTWMNVLGLRKGALIQNVSTFLKVAALGVFVVLGFWAGLGPAHELPSAMGTGESFSLVTGFGLALVAVLWSFDGFNNLNFSAGEIKDPGRTLPRALILGTAVITAIYLLVNVVYVIALPIPDMRGVLSVAEKAASALLGAGAATFIAIAIVISTFGATNGTILAGARVYYAMANDGLFFRSVARVHRRYRTPHVSLWLQCFWACVLALSGTFEQLFTYATFAAILLYAAAAASVFTLRRKHPDLPRPYKVWGFPVVPAFFMISVLAIAITVLIERPLQSFSGLIILALGIPAYYYWRHKSTETNTTT
jgi:APA family basic amino acid/polyamine antiporter